MFDLARVGATLRAIVIGLTDREVGFQVTPKGASGSPERRHGPVPTVLVMFAGAHLTIAWYVARSLGTTPMSYRSLGVVHGAAFWAVVNGGRARCDRRATGPRSGSRSPRTSWTNRRLALGLFHAGQARSVAEHGVSSRGAERVGA